MSLDTEISIDCFAGGGGASCGIALATGRSPAVAINHWPTALSVHEANHPETHHLIEDIWAVDPLEAVAGQAVGVAWFSPDCTHFSRAKAGKPRSNALRGLADAILPWARLVRFRLGVVENVAEFVHWGPLHEDHTNGCTGEHGQPCPSSVGPKCHYGTPIKERRGEFFRAWVSELQRLDYTVDWRVLAARDYGTPTTRRRLYVVLRRGREIVRWPEPTHGPGRAKPWGTAADDVIDWSLPIPSIFNRPKPLADATLRRIARGIRRFVIESASPFLLHLTHGGRLHPLNSPVPTVTSANRGELAVVAPTLVHVSNGERPGQAPRVYDIEAPLNTVVSGGIKQGLVAAYLARHFGGRGTDGSPLGEPARTVTAQDHHALVAAFLARYQGTGEPEPVTRPLGTLTARDRYGLVGVTVNVAGAPHTIVDIGMRLLTPRELARAQGFPDSYVIERGADGRRVTRTDQVRLIGNSVCQQVAAAIISANSTPAPAASAAASVSNNR